MENEPGSSPQKLSEQEVAIRFNEYLKLVKNAEAKDVFEARDILSRKENEIEWQRQADLINKARPLWKKITGRDFLKLKDIAQEEAGKVNECLDNLIADGEAENYHEALKIFRDKTNHFLSDNEQISEEQLNELQLQINEREEDQEEFEKLTKIAFDSFMELPKRIDMKTITINEYGEHDKWRTPGILCDYLYNIDRSKGYPDSFCVLEVAGGDSPQGRFFKGLAHYTNIDLVALEHFEEGIGNKFDNKLYEDLKIDILDIPKYLDGRTYDYIFGEALFGLPTELGAEDEKIGTIEEHERNLLSAINKVSRDGALLLFSSREGMFHFDKKELGEIGFDYSPFKRIGNSDEVYILLRKIPKTELGGKTEANDNREA